MSDDTYIPASWMEEDDETIEQWLGEDKATAKLHETRIKQAKYHTGDVVFVHDADYDPRLGGGKTKRHGIGRVVEVEFTDFANKGASYSIRPVADYPFGVKCAWYREDELLAKVNEEVITLTSDMRQKLGLEVNVMPEKKVYHREWEELKKYEIRELVLPGLIVKHREDQIRIRHDEGSSSWTVILNADGTWRVLYDNTDSTHEVVPADWEGTHGFREGSDWEINDDEYSNNADGVT